MDNTFFTLYKSQKPKFILKFQLEACDEEVSDSVYQEYLRRITGRSEPQEYHHRHFRVREQDFITLRESTSFVSNGTTGLSTWEVC